MDTLVMDTFLDLIFMFSEFGTIVQFQTIFHNDTQSTNHKSSVEASPVNAFTQNHRHVWQNMYILL